MLTTGPRGTKDVLPGESFKWQYLENEIRSLCGLFGYREIRTPVFEHTELFLRGIGETTDIVEKEMYTFTDRGDRSLTLRPENTAAAVRMYLEHKLYAETQLNKLYYIGPMFRYDRPQAGRYRQFHQFGVEAIGASGAVIDAEIIALAMRLFLQLGLRDLRLYVNSVGCPTCRKAYRAKLQEFFQPKFDELCDDCRSRYDRNPLRILDCKNARCQELSAGVPEIVDSLCGDCAAHFQELQNMLKVANIEFRLNPRLVRGLDYYTRTAFEIQYAPLGAQSAICGGGRYDGLIAECGGQPTPAIGFAIGLERLLLALDQQSLLPEETGALDVFIVTLEGGAPAAFKLLGEFRAAGVGAEMDYLGKSLKAQLKAANKTGARYAVMVGGEELAAGQAVVRDMREKKQEAVSMAQVVGQILAEVKE